MEVALGLDGNAGLGWAEASLGQRAYQRALRIANPALGTLRQRAAARLAASLGYASLWLPDWPGIDAFAHSVSCERLGAHIAEYLEVGTIDLYARACEVALMSLAAEIYERLESAPVPLVIAGSAHAIDADGDGPMDAITTGAWTGTFAGAPLAPSSFEGTAR